MKALRWKNKDKGKKGETKQTETNTKATIKPRKKDKVKINYPFWANRATAALRLWKYLER